MNRRSLLVGLASTGATGCLGSDDSTASTASDPPGTEPLGSNETATRSRSDGTDSPTESSSGPGTIRVRNRTDARIDVRVEVQSLTSGGGPFLDWVLVGPGATTERSFGVETAGEYRTVATMPTLGERTVDWTATHEWEVARTTDLPVLLVEVRPEGMDVSITDADSSD